MVGLAVTPTTPSSSSRRLNWPEVSCERSMLSYQTLCPSDLSCSNGLVMVISPCGSAMLGDPYSVSILLSFVTMYYLLVVNTIIKVLLTHSVYVLLHDSTLMKKNTNVKEMGYFK